MEKYTKEGLNIYFMREERYNLSNTEKASIKICVSYKRKRAYYPTGVRLTVDEWKSIDTGKGRKLIEHRNNLENTFSKVKHFAHKLMAEGKFSFDNLRVRMDGTACISIKDTILNKVKRLKSLEAFGTADIYINAYLSFSNYRDDALRFEDITVSWLNGYERYMITQGKSYTTIGMYLRSLRAIFNEAMDAGIIDATLYPFGKRKYEIPISVGRKLALLLSQIKQIKEYKYDENSAGAYYRDLWLFSYLCNGANFKDILQLRYGNIQGDEISFLREKTKRTSKEKKEIIAFITPEMWSIIKKWGNTNTDKENYIFTHLNCIHDPVKRRNMIKDVIKRTNKNMKQLGTALGIANLTTYVARHSYATVLKRSGANIAFISESLGHSDIKTTENYLASFESDERKKNAQLLTQRK
ncbi:MAG: site-specific integrase [Oscillospiraceae bacterium]|jgi:integrase|nr:site-specific integrase [Oscillospiraceae bacterium]